MNPAGTGAVVVIPTYQEVENIREVLTRVRAAVPDAHILVVDGGSSDGTADLVRSLGAELDNIDLLDAEHTEGLGGAYRAGFEVVLDRGYEVAVEMDADLSHDPDALPTLLQAIEAGADLAIGSRYVPGGSIPDWPLHRRALSRYGNRYAAFVLGLHATDATSGFRAYRTQVLREVSFDATRATGYAFQVELTYRVTQWGGRINEVPIVFADRVRGHSKMSARIAVEAMILVTWWGVRDRVLRRRRRR